MDGQEQKNLLFASYLLSRLGFRPYKIDRRLPGKARAGRVPAQPGQHGNGTFRGKLQQKRTDVSVLNIDFYLFGSIGH